MVKGQDAHSTESRAVTLLNDAAGAFSGQDAAGIEQVPRVPGLSASLRHLNAGLTFSGVNAANSGWYTVITPAVSYSLDSHFSADLSFSASSSLIGKREEPVLKPRNPTAARKPSGKFPAENMV